jgi:Histidine kinase-, DNA gyrase B-, and HSP90-like ATPase
MRQILLNLLSNACKFTKAREVKLAARKVSNGSNFVEFAVSDTGTGMSAERANLGPGVSLTLAAMAAMALYNVYRAKQSERRHPPRGRFVTVEGVRLHYLEAGSGRRRRGDRINKRA